MSDREGTTSSEEQPPARWKDAFRTIGSVAGIAALLWNASWTISNAQGSYLQLALDVRSANSGNAIALATVENKSEFSKTIDDAPLVHFTSARGH